MKRLITSKNEVEFLDNWVGYHYKIKQSLIESVIKNNQDCFYNGKAYRGLILSAQNFFEKLKFDTTYEGLPAASKISVENAVKTCIMVDDKYQSYSTKLDGVLQYLGDNSFDEEEHTFLIESDLTNALDISKLYKKYKEEYDEKYRNQDGSNWDYEVVGKLDNFNLIGRLVFPDGRLANNYLYVKDYPRFKVTQEAIDNIIDRYGEDVYEQYKEKIDQGIYPDYFMYPEMYEGHDFIRFVEL